MRDFIITEIRIDNFRSLADVWVPLRKQTVLIGENNSGKTSFLDAFALVFAESEARFSADDIFLEADRSLAPRERKACVDIRIEPAGDEKEFKDETRGFFGDAIQLGKGDERDYIAIRAELGWDKNREEYRRSRSFLKGWARKKTEAVQIQILTRPTFRREFLELFPFYYLDAKRDIQDQLHARQSFWGKLASDLQLDDDIQKKIEKALYDVNELIRSKSPVLAHLRKRLEELYRTVASEQSGVQITPLPQQLRDLVRGMDVLFKTHDAHAFPLSRHGMGTRSMAALLVFHAFIEWQLKRSREITPLPIVALEEPEAHLHPHAQRALFDQLAEIDGQKLISTHSPHVVSHAQLFDFVLFRKNGSETKVSMIPEKNHDGSDFLEPEVAHKVYSFVQIQNTELFFSRVMVLFEGPTEQNALPVFALAYFKRRPDSVGISFIPADGVGNYDPFLKIAEKLRMPWVILTDSEPEALKQLAKCFQKAGLERASFNTQIVEFPTGQDFERYLITSGYGPEIESVIAEQFGVNALQNFKNKRQAQPGNIFDYNAPGGHENALNDFMDSRRHSKTFFGRYLAEKIVSTRTGDDRIPEKLRELFSKVDQLCKQVY
ncbi:AAA family ATPase [candidate division KSB1 bacterium]|nr:AAA family ATPase [candidate division KSB1 bacterium]